MLELIRIHPREEQGRSSYTDTCTIGTIGLHLVHIDSKTRAARSLTQRS